jgi:glycine betaine/proline transport system substrate-binding protein
MIRFSMGKLLSIMALFAVMALVVAACDDDASDDAPADDVSTEDVDTDTDDSEATESDDGEAAQDEWHGERSIVFADYGWDGPLFHNRVAQFILEEGYGYETDTVPGETIPLFQGQIDGDIDISTEIWLDQMPPYQPAVEEGTIVDLGQNFDGGTQGWYVPTYVIEGDEERGIEPMAPDLSHVDDLPEYWEIFQDPEDDTKGRIYDGVAGWELERVNEVKVPAYGLDEYYNRFLPGSGPALHTSLIAAYERGEPWLGFQWVPNWVTGLYDLTKLEEPEYSDECWEKTEQAVEEGTALDEACAWPISDVHMAANAEFADEAPDVIEFFRNYETTLEQNDMALAYMAENEVGHQEAAIWFLQEYEDTWTEWVPDDVADRVREALEGHE